MVDDKPQVKSGWGAGGGAIGDSAIGMAKKSNAAAYWDNRITELIIPEMEAEIAEAEEVQISAPATVQTKMIGLAELNKDFAMNVPSVTHDGIDISLLTCTIRPILDLIETDMHWDYASLQAEIGQNFREKYANDGSSVIEGTKANNI